MAKKKLTLTIDEGAIDNARRYSAGQNTSISRLVSQFLSGLPTGKQRFSPTVERLSGVLPSDVDETDYYRHLEEKHLG